MSTQRATPIPHPPHKEGSRHHVLYYVGIRRNGRLVGQIKCSEPQCEKNQESR